MSGAAPEFSRPVSVLRLGGGPYRQHLAASESERAALAERFELVALDRLEADIELAHEPGGTILLTANFTADFAQRCTITLDPVPGSLDERFQLRYGRPEAEPAAPSGDDDPAFEPLDAEAIDLGEAVAQEFSLALPPFPRAPDAIIEDAAAETADQDGPFAALARLVARDRG